MSQNDDTRESYGRVLCGLAFIVKEKKWEVTTPMMSSHCLADSLPWLLPLITQEVCTLG